MLVLSRRVGEQILLGDDVVVTVISIRGDKIRLGFTAPQEVAIHREEVYRRICNRRAEEDLNRSEELEAIHS
jgi:carbon storage regulator